jgi:hypothetical protein
MQKNECHMQSEQKLRMKTDSPSLLFPLSSGNRSEDEERSGTSDGSLI